MRVYMNNIKKIVINIGIVIDMHNIEFKYVICFIWLKNLPWHAVHFLFQCSNVF